MEIDLGFWAFILVVWLFCGLLGYSIGKPMKMGSTGFCWGFSFGPLGLIIITLLTIREKLPDPDLLLMALGKKGSSAAAAAAPVRSAVSRIPQGAKVKIARGETEIGAWSMAEIRGFLEGGELTLEDSYYDGAAKAWLALAAHPTLA